jgi:drug/metabolite transporter (DMT)-like permease
MPRHFLLLTCKYVACIAAADAADATVVLQANGIAKGSLKETLLLAIPSFFDLVATVLMNIGLLSVTASVYQMMRGAEMLFAALFAVLFLKRHLNRFHYMGIGCCAVRVAAAGFRGVELQH